MKKQLLSIALLLSVGSSQAMMAVLAAQQKSIPTKITVGENVTVTGKKLNGDITTTGPITAVQNGNDLVLYASRAGQGTILVDGKEVATVYGAHSDITATPTNLVVNQTIYAENNDGNRFEPINTKDENAGSVNISHKGGKVKITPKSEGTVVIANNETGEVVKIFLIESAAQ